MSDSPWLDAADERFWRDWLRLNSLLPAVLHQELRSDADLSLSDFDVLVALTDRPDERLRVSDLADVLQWERSRLSHHLKRMERRGLLNREECQDDGRGSWVVLSAVGREAIERAAPGHVNAVRRYVFDLLSREEIDAVAIVVKKMLANLEQRPEA